MTKMTRQRLGFVLFFVFLDLDGDSFHAEDGDYGEANQCSQPPEQEEEWEASV